MNPYTKKAITVSACCFFYFAHAQTADSTVAGNEPAVNFQRTLVRVQPEKKHFPLASLLITGSLITYGFTSLGNEGLKHLNRDFQEDIWTDRPHRLVDIDNYLMLAPAISVYGLNAIGIKGRNNFKDRTMILLLSNVIMTTTVFSIKKISRQLRPDGSNYNSFPSGHTATAFSSAEFLYQEYKEISPWYGVAGYAMATTTGYLRMYNNKHWLSDVVSGAGIGIISAKISYWLYPKIKEKFIRNTMPGTVIMPSFQNLSPGIVIIHQF